jgi:ABC-2 type transport system permease protein
MSTMDRSLSLNTGRSRTWGALCVGFWMSFRRTMRNPGALLFAVFFHTMVTLALSAVWRSSVAAAGGSVNGYNAGAITWYVVFVEIATVTSTSRLIADVIDDIGTGRVQMEMLRPATVVLHRIAIALGAVMAKVAVCTVSGAALGLLLGGQPPHIGAALIAVLSAALAVVCMVCFQHAVGSIGFWFRRVGTIWFIYAKLVFVLGGTLIPLEMLPDRLAFVAKLLPFHAMAYAPGRFAAGHLDWWLLGSQIFWIAIGAGCAVWVFSIGERRVVAGRS